MHIHSLTRAALAACVAAVFAAAPASAAPVQAQLRVEAGGFDLDRGWSYVNDTATFRTSRSAACGGTGDRKTVSGPTALGLLVHGADYNRRLRPVEVSDQFDFGLFVCGIGGFRSGPSAYWLYKVNHRGPEVGADQYRIRPGDQVLFYYQDTETGSNIGNELELRVGRTRLAKGRSTTVRAFEYDFEGRRAPAEGVRLVGAGDAMTGPDGRATIAFGRPGLPAVRGVRAGDIPTRVERFCIWKRAARECRRFTSERIVGTRGDDVIKGSSRRDLIIARAGNDRIDVRGGGIDRVRCGPGKDTVLADKRDRVGRGCERVIRR